MEHIDWNALIRLGEYALGGYVAATTLHWLLTDVLVPLFGLFVTWRVAANLRRAVGAYVAWRQKSARQEAQQAPVMISAPAETRYVSRVHDRLR